jgi:Rrf2 family protein
MSKVVTLSEAGSIAIHAIVLVARSNDMINVNKISEATQASRHHVAKIMQRLVKDGYLFSTRGPRGGFYMRRDPRNISLLEIYESIEGEIQVGDCMMDYPICPFDKCLMGTLVKDLTQDFKNYMTRMKVADYMN